MTFFVTFSSILRVNRNIWFNRFISSSSRLSFNASTTTLLRYSYLFRNQTGNNTTNKLSLHALPPICYEVSFIISESKPTNGSVIHERVLYHTNKNHQFSFPKQWVSKTISIDRGGTKTRWHYKNWEKRKSINKECGSWMVPSYSN
jgi:hypothetical protein